MPKTNKLKAKKIKNEVNVIVKRKLLLSLIMLLLLPLERVLSFKFPIPLISNFEYFVF